MAAIPSTSTTLLRVLLTTGLLQSTVSSSTTSRLYGPSLFGVVGVHSHSQSALSSLSLSSSVSSSSAALLKPNTRPKTLSSVSFRALWNVRGGSDEDEDESDEEDESDAEEQEEDDDDEDAAFFANLKVEEVNEADFAEENWLDRQIEDFKDTPPITKAYLTAAFGAALAGMVVNKGEFPTLLSLDWTKVFTRLQIWRPVTAFLNVGSLGIFWFLTAQFVLEYMGTLERLLCKTPYDFWIMVAFGILSMVTVYPALKLSPKFLGHNLSTYLVYVWSRYHEGQQVNLLDMILMNAELLPWFMVGQTALLEGAVPTLDILGIVFGHVYYYLKSIGVLTAPKWLVSWYQDSPSAKTIRDKYSTISSDFGGV